ncbi:putative Acyl-CoA N-acyltransferase [Vibrio nigripulchritudo SFn27]|uniref:Putative Acyl-CoA N-acyltransferase n=1 Tax=Vibrio nigripulchritudo TaxID=28173 RepID=U4KAL4_9VIBR|nr:MULTISPECIES: GNAT family N-acetyltransferase [Vibrio]UAB71617.1 GNAT family N-acetyltransferase [Vibrio sp. SCSIO 43132]CCN83634.1 putative Acyl-CoA N-acyltransferase [Vibrio nigripulchritudo BLFn1]CCN87360.1 putative Acyl-CoA N-acyltransferase [Vibrio nigripulchritudo SFn27]CCN94739.1 putative Acyl-CoA N-acyltransferase [Vibrio nigripulchritudo ENn2]CCO40720.1 putative Acyl-CoA N-acyltransferase [Vibrio nigripulchritudo SFn135]
MEIKIDLLDGQEIVALLNEHLEDMYATSPPESVHALDLDALKKPDITFWSAWDEGELLGCAALKQLDATHAEIKSMRTARTARNRGVASQLLKHVLNVAKERNYSRLSLETGSMEFFKPARTLYEKHGFEYCPPFADYQPDPNSEFMTKKL